MNIIWINIWFFIQNFAKKFKSLNAANSILYNINFYKSWVLSVLYPTMYKTATALSNFKFSITDLHGYMVI